MKTGTTLRGFVIAKWVDRYGLECSIQKSSLAFEDCIWLGVAEDRVQQLNPDGPGWVDVELPEGSLVHRRMHLTQEMAAALAPMLQHFADHGELPKERS